MAVCRKLCGYDPILEEQANEILAQDRRSQGRSKRDRVDYLTDGQMYRRRRREIYNKNGYPESHLYNGLFKRAYNPSMNKKRGATSSEE